MTRLEMQQYPAFCLKKENGWTDLSIPVLLTLLGTLTKPRTNIRGGVIGPMHATITKAGELIMRWLANPWKKTSKELLSSPMRGTQTIVLWAWN